MPGRPARGDAVPISAVTVDAYRVPTATRPESDGTHEWDSTGLVVAHVEAGGVRGMGYGYIHQAGAALIRDDLASAIHGLNAVDIPRAWDAMRARMRNVGLAGLAMSAIAVIDIALWDLKSRLLDLAVSALMGARREAIPVYGSGGFTSYSDDQLRDQLSDWAARGLRAVKMKVGRESDRPQRDLARVRVARDAIGRDVALYVDANGAFSAPRAIAMAHAFAEHDVAWFEEPVPSDDRAGLRRVRAATPPGMRIAAGEYGATARYFRRFCQDEAADVLMPDVVRTGGFTGFLRCAETCHAFDVPISAHTAPQLDAHVCPAAPGCLHAEYFHDHARIDSMLFDGVIEPRDGVLRPDRTRPGHGLTFKAADAEPFRVS